MQKYYLTHDPTFKEKANLSKFNTKILDITGPVENLFIFNIIKNAPKNGVILDIGAYNGDTTVYLSRKLKEIGREDVKIICFEPNTKLCSIIKSYKDRFGLNIEIYNNIISDCAKKLYMKKNEGPGTMYDTCYKSNIYYDSITLDSLGIKNVYFCKIDVEGHEPEVLNGAVKTLSDCKYMYIEMWNDHHFKNRHGHKLEGSHNERILNSIKNINNNFLPLQKIEKNILFENFSQ